MGRSTTTPKASKSKMPPFPKEPGAAIDLLYTRQQARIAKSRELDELASQEKALEQYILTLFGQQKLEGAKGKLATAGVEEVEVPKVDDWDIFWAYVLKTKRVTLMQKRVGVTAIRELWDENKVVPGVSRLPIKKLSLHKR